MTFDIIKEIEQRLDRLERAVFASVDDYPTGHHTMQAQLDELYHLVAALQANQRRNAPPAGTIPAGLSREELAADGEAVRMVTLIGIPDDLLDGLPAKDQAEILAAVGHPVKIVEEDDQTCRVFVPPNEIEIEWKAADGAIHTLWVEPHHLVDQREVMRRVIERDAILLARLAKR